MQLLDVTHSFKLLEWELNKPYPNFNIVLSKETLLKETYYWVNLSNSIESFYNHNKERIFLNFINNNSTNVLLKLDPLYNLENLDNDSLIEIGNKALNNYKKYFHLIYC